MNRVEEELRLLGDGTDGESTTRRGSTSARRSFFKRIKPQRSSSRDSKELASFSNTHLSLNLESALNEFDSVSSYQRVERLECENFFFTFLYEISLKKLFFFSQISSSIGVRPSSGIRRRQINE